MLYDLRNIKIKMSQKSQDSPKGLPFGLPYFNNKIFPKIVSCVDQGSNTRILHIQQISVQLAYGAPTSDRIANICYCSYICMPLMKKQSIQDSRWLGNCTYNIVCMAKQYLCRRKTFSQLIYVTCILDVCILIGFAGVLWA